MYLELGFVSGCLTLYVENLRLVSKNNLDTDIFVFLLCLSLPWSQYLVSPSVLLSFNPFCCSSLPAWDHVRITLIIIKTWIFSSVQSTNGVCACVVTSLYTTFAFCSLVFYSLGNRFLPCPRSSACLSLTPRTTPLFFFHWPLTANTVLPSLFKSRQNSFKALLCLTQANLPLWPV